MLSEHMPNALLISQFSTVSGNTAMELLYCPKGFPGYVQILPFDVNV